MGNAVRGVAEGSEEVLDLKSGLVANPLGLLLVRVPGLPVLGPLFCTLPTDPPASSPDVGVLGLELVLLSRTGHLTRLAQSDYPDVTPSVAPWSPFPGVPGLRIACSRICDEAPSPA